MATAPESIDEYIASAAEDVRATLEDIRATVRQAAPEAEELISYRIPAFRLGEILVYFAAFKNHIGFYPPVKGDPKLERDVVRYAGEKGNLRFPLSDPIPLKLIERIVKHRVKQVAEAKKPKAPRPKK